MSDSPLDVAKGLVHGDRNKDYAHPHVDYSCTAALWRALIKRRYGVDVALEHDFACLMMVAVKLSRESGKHKQDNLIDAAGYVECADMCLKRDEEIRQEQYEKQTATETFGPLKQP
jgi:hypothetical protein